MFPRDLTQWDELRDGGAILSDSVAMRLRRHNLYCGGVQLGIRDNRFKNVSRQKLLPHSTHLMREIKAAALELLRDAWRTPTDKKLS